MLRNAAFFNKESYEDVVNSMTEISIDFINGHEINLFEKGIKDLRLRGLYWDRGQKQYKKIYTHPIKRIYFPNPKNIRICRAIAEDDIEFSFEPNDDCINSIKLLSYLA